MSRGFSAGLRPTARCREGRRRIPVALFAGAAAVLCGCAYSYTDTNGNHHTIGRLDITVRPSAAPKTLAGDVVEITTFGVSIGQTAQGGYVTLGFNREASAALRDNAVVLGDPINALRPAD